MAWDDAFTARDYDRYMGYDQPEDDGPGRCDFCGCAYIVGCAGDCPSRPENEPGEPRVFERERKVA